MPEDQIGEVVTGGCITEVEGLRERLTATFDEVSIAVLEGYDTVGK